MPLFTLTETELAEVPSTTFRSQRVFERTHLQTALKKRIDIIAPDCFVIAEEFAQWQGSQRRIDLLAIDKNANLVVIELKRNETGEHMDLQAIRYASMVSTMTYRQAIEALRRYRSAMGEDCDAEQEVLEFLEWAEPREEDFALEVKIVLVSADFSQELTTSVMWLNQSGLDIRCIRMVPYEFEGNLLVDVQQIIPVPEAENYQVKIKQQIDERRDARQAEKDYTQYRFEGQTYNKRKLVLAVIKHWVLMNCPQSIDELRNAFPAAVRTNLFREYEIARQQFEETRIDRYFLAENDRFEFQNQSWVVCNQWGKKNLPLFIDHVVKNLGYEICAEA